MSDNNIGSFDPNIHVPGLWYCAKCQFSLMQSNLNSVDGTVTARDQAGDHCPNDGSPLWRVTWRQHAVDLGERLERMFDETINRASAADLITRFYRRKIGVLMQQARHWMNDGRHPLAVHHRVFAADEFYQVVAHFDPENRKLGRDDPFVLMEKELERATIYPPGDYPPSKDLHAYRNPCFVAEKYNELKR